MVQLLLTCIGAAGIPLSYMIRDTCQDWEDTHGINYLQDRRTATKIHYGNSFKIDNKYLFRILLYKFYSTAPEDVILIQQRNQNGTVAWKIINPNVKGASYNIELKR